MVKSKFILTAEDYRANIDIEDERSNSSMINKFMVIKLLVFFMILGVVFWAYNYFFKNTPIQVEREVLPIRYVRTTLLNKEQKIPLITKHRMLENKVKTIDNIEKEKVNSPQNKLIEQKELSDAYIKLVQESLGKY